MKRLRIGRSLSVYIEPRDIWIGVYVAPDRIYICPLPLLVIRLSRRSACRWENHDECPGCSWCSCHKPPHTCTPFDPPEQQLADCQRCRDMAPKGSAS